MTYNTTMTNYMNAVAGWDDSQITAISSTKRSMGAISVLGSAYIIQDVLRDPQKRKHTFHRIMVGLSTIDLLSSFFTHVLSTTLMPSGYHMLAVGSIATCDAQGFITTLSGYATPLYNCSLSTYYLVQLKHNWPTRRVEALEKWLHIVPLALGLIGATTLLALNAYGPVGFSCGPSPAYPLACYYNPSQCERGGQDVYKISHLVLLVVVILSICYVAITMFMVYKSVSKIEILAHQYSFARYKPDTDYRMRSRLVMIQGIMYGAVLILVHLFALILFMIQLITGKQKSIYSLSFLMYTFWPLQGFLNALIHSFPALQKRYRNWKAKRGDESNRKITTVNSSQTQSTRSSNWLSFLRREFNSSTKSLQPDNAEQKGSMRFIASFLQGSKKKQRIITMVSEVESKSMSKMSSKLDCQSQSSKFCINLDEDIESHSLDKDIESLNLDKDNLPLNLDNLIESDDKNAKGPQHNNQRLRQVSFNLNTNIESNSCKQHTPIQHSHHQLDLGTIDDEKDDDEQKDDEQEYFLPGHCESYKGGKEDDD